MADSATTNNNNNSAASTATTKKPTAKKTGQATDKSTFVNPTPVGEKKDLTKPMADAYTPMAVESAWYDYWDKQGYFTADNTDKTKEKFVIMIPPPNVTGTLHLGHTLTCSIQDCIVRWNRMNGKNTLWLPGVDHAGIATQAVVERKLKNEKGVTKHDLGREKFLEEVWKWKEQYGNTICTQLKRTGASVDWSRMAFTMDQQCSTAVTEAFTRLFNDGTIYRATRLVNWCCTLKTAIANIEVDYQEIDKATKLSVPGYDKKIEFGVLYSFAYKIENSEEEIIVATTRPETMLGDTAIAVHPNDPRYTHLHGKFVVHPFNGRRIPIITDGILVSMEFGTGAVKVTPAHDPNDYECGKRNNLEFINIFTEDGLINENGAPYNGMKRFDVRYAVVKELETRKLLKERKDHSYSLARCSRSNDIIEPLIKPQWYCDCKQMAEDSCKAVREGRLKIIPQMHEAKWFHWLENIQDWCISRQLWWGHRIPAYLISIDGVKLDDKKTDSWVVGKTQEAAFAEAVKKFPNVDKSTITISQDEDVLDTWFSSGLFPFATLGWPNQTPDMDNFYPGNLLETGHDILFFWVARMVMMGLKLTGKLPFTEVYLHAMVRDKLGRKMSKSLGNVINPIDVIEGITLEELYQTLAGGNLDKNEIETAKKGQKEQFPDGIAECGADALRLALLAYTTQGRDINLDINRVVGYRNFCNKLWNATKYSLMHLHDFKATSALPVKSDDLSSADKWILCKLNKAISSSIQGMKDYDFGAVTTACYNFWLYELCDVYLELTKPIMNSDLTVEVNAKKRSTAQHVLFTCIEQGLRLLHPSMPFVTEELWHRLPGRDALPHGKSDSIMICPYPTPNSEWENAEIEGEMEIILHCVHTVRSLKASYSLTNQQRPPVYIRCASDPILNLVTLEKDNIKALGVAGDIAALKANEQAPVGCAVDFANENCAVFLMIKGLIDVNAEVSKLEKKKEKLDAAKAQIQKSMNSPNYGKVPENVKEQNNQKLASTEKEISGIESALESLKNMSI